MNLSSYPNLVNEWHPTKNGDFTPDDFTHGSDKKVCGIVQKNTVIKQLLKIELSKRVSVHIVQIKKLAQ